MKILGVLAVAMLIASSCGDDDDTTASDDTSTEDDGGADPTAKPDPTATSAPDDPTPQPTVTPGENMLAADYSGDDGCTADRVGGEATVGLLRQTSTLDPTKALGSGVAGGTEIAAIYDTLILYDASDGSFKPHVAESVVSNDDRDEYTVTLRSGIKFGNGDPLTTAAVKFSFERMAEATVSSAGLVADVVDMTIVDDLTIIFKLKEPSASFLYVLSEDAGNITNPNVVNSMTEEEFALDPGGAGVGPYTVESFAPGEALVLAAKDDYWRGPVCVETLTITSVAGAPATLEAFQLGEFDVAYFANAPLQVAELRDDGIATLGQVTNGATVMVFDIARTDNSPVADVRLRRAVHAAMDVELIDQRVFDGAGIPGSSLVEPNQGWSPGIPGPQYDEALAKSLVEEVKADGWDGKLTLVANNAPASAVDTAILVEGLLEAVGIDVELVLLPSGEVRTRVVDEPDFDLAFFGISAFEEAPTARYTSYLTGNVRNRTGYGTPEMDAAIGELNQALTREDKKAAMATMQEIWNEDIPSVILAHGEWIVASADNVHGIFISRDVAPMFFDMWVE